MPGNKKNNKKNKKKGNKKLNGEKTEKKLEKKYTKLLSENIIKIPMKGSYGSIKKLNRKYFETLQEGFQEGLNSENNDLTFGLQSSDIKEILSNQFDNLILKTTDGFLAEDSFEGCSLRERVFLSYIKNGVINHPNLPKVYLIREMDNKFYYFMEDGGITLTRYSEETENKKKIESFNKIFGQLFSVINYLHNLGLIHGDIKPDNILINESNKIKIIDFGMTAFNLDNGLFSRSLSTIMIRTPEELKNGSRSLISTNKIDVWAIGMCMLYYLTKKDVCNLLENDKDDDDMSDDEELLNIFRHQMVKFNKHFVLPENVGTFPKGSESFVKIMNDVLIFDVNERLNCKYFLDKYFTEFSNIIESKSENRDNHTKHILPRIKMSEPHTQSELDASQIRSPDWVGLDSKSSNELKNILKSFDVSPIEQTTISLYNKVKDSIDVKVIGNINKDKLILLTCAFVVSFALVQNFDVFVIDDMLDLVVSTDEAKEKELVTNKIKREKERENRKNKNHNRRKNEDDESNPDGDLDEEEEDFNYYDKVTELIMETINSILNKVDYRVYF